MKPIMNLGQKRSFNTYSWGGGSLVLTDSTRGMHLEKFSQACNFKRFQEYVPQNIEVPEWSQELLDKEMELVIMKIKTSRNWEKQHAEGSSIPSYKRTITRQDNEEGRAIRTVREMQEIAD